MECRRVRFRSRADPRLAGEGRAAERAGQRGEVPVAVGKGKHFDAGVDAAGADAQPRQLRGLARQRLPLAGRAGRGARRRDLSGLRRRRGRSEEHTSELQSLMRISYAVFCLKKKKKETTKKE